MYVFEYTVAVQMVVSPLVVVGNGILRTSAQDLQKSSQCSYLLSHLTSPQYLSYFKPRSHYISQTALALLSSCLSL